MDNFIASLSAPPRQLRSQLHDEIQGKLRSMILRCELMPGTRISERDLCARFGVSRTPLREALKVLASSGLIDLVPRRGAWVPPIRLAEVSEVFDVLMLLERRAGELAASRLLKRDIKELATLQERLVAQVQAGDPERSIRTDFRIHRKLIEAAGNRTLADLHEGLAVRVERVRYMVGTSRSRMLDAVAEHEAILKAVEARDPARIADEVHRHCVRTRDAVLVAVQARFGDGAGQSPPLDLDDVA